MIIFSFDEGTQFSATRSGMSGHAGMVVPVAYWIYLRVLSRLCPTMVCPIFRQTHNMDIVGYRTHYTHINIPLNPGFHGFIAIVYGYIILIKSPLCHH